ncbi:MAG: dihydroneopterin aldolase [Bacteroidota bacterium]|jgi:dihydroneopterin aldolase
MAVIALEGMRFYAHHGFYESEQVLGGEYVVDVIMKVHSFAGAAIEDDLGKTINYETIHLICARIMRKRFRLIETVASHIAQDIKHQFRNISELKVSIKKMHPPLGGRVDAARVEVDGNFQRRCARCDKPMLCYGDHSCWCMDTKIFGKTQEQLQAQFGNRCLCKDCLAYFAY